MEGPRVFFATVLRDPLSEVTRNERVYLLGTSVVGIAIMKTGLVPTQISALGIEFEEADQENFLFLLGLVVLYFLAAFVVYATSDFLAWWEGYQAALGEAIEPSVKLLQELEEKLKELQETSPTEGRSEDLSQELLLSKQKQMFEQWWARAGPTFTRRRRTQRTGLVVATIRALFEYLLPVLVGGYAAYILIL